MRALFVTALAGLLSPLYSFASLDSVGDFKSIDFANYTLYYRSSSEYGAPVATNDGTIQFFPESMSVKGSHFNTDTFVTTIAIVPKSEFQISTLDFIEYGDYRFRQGSSGSSAEFEVNSRLFISSFDDNDIFHYDVLGADGVYTANESTSFTTWELSDSYDISNYAGGFFLTIQNTLTVATLPGANYNPDNASGFWKDLQIASSGNNSNYEGHEEGGHSYKGKKHKKKYKHKYKDKWDYSDDFLQIDKKRFALHLNGSVSEVPVPAAAWLFASALGAMAIIRRRKAVH